jgi:ribosomal protein S16
MLNIRLQRVGRKNDSSFRLVLINSKYAARSGKAIEVLGSVDFRKKTIEKESFKADKIKAFIKDGAQVSPTVFNLFVDAGIMEGKKKNVLPKKTPQKKAEDKK